MQATITFLLSEQAQRAAMVATGQPVTRKQSITIDVAAEDLQYYPIASDGSITVDLVNGTHIAAHRVNVGPFAGPPSIPDLVRAAIAEEEATKQKKQAERDENLADQLAAVERFMADPAMRVSTGAGYVYIGATRVDRDANEFHPACPRWEEMLPEAVRRNTIDADARKAKETDEQAAKVVKEEKDRAKEVAKTDFIRAWIAEHGTPSQQVRSASDMLCRDEAIRAMADATFARLSSVGTEYTKNLRPHHECTNEECNAEDCQVKYSVEDSVDCLSEGEYYRYAAIETAMPKAEYVLRTRSAVHDCSHSPSCTSGEIHTCLVKQPVGPLVLQREYVL
jgi:hypothetical protein